MIVKEMGVTFDYVLYEMDWFVFLENYNWLLMYSHGHARTWIKDGAEESGMKYRVVWDEANANMIDYVEDEKHRYVWEPKRNCFVLPKGK